MNNLFTFFYNLSSYSWIGQFALFLSYPFFYGSMILLLGWSFFYSKEKIFTFSLISLSMAMSWAIAHILKYIFQTVRPYIDLGIVPLYIENTSSFPSAHSAIFACIATSLLYVHKPLGVLFIILAFLIGLSRIVIGVHYPVDVIGGWVLGVLISLVLIYFGKKI